MRLEEWLKSNADKLGSKYERYFVERVLTRVSELDVDALQAQMPFRDKQGGRRYCDFAIREGDGVRIVLEVDGYDKTGRGTGMTYAEFEDWQRRQNALETQGWRVLRFANRTVMRHPAECAEHVSLLLRAERQKESHRSNLNAEIQNKKRELGSLTKRLKRGSDRSSAPSSEMRTALKKERELRDELMRAKQQLHNAKKSKALTQGEAKRLSELQEKLKVTEQDNNIMKTMIWSFTTLIAVILIVLVIQLGERNRQPDTSRSPSQLANGNSVEQPTESMSEVGSSCRNPLDWREVGRYVGKRVSVAGPAVGTAVGENVQGRPTWINIGEPFPSENRLSLVIWQRNIRQFQSALEWNLSGGQRVCATGEISEYRGVPQIELTHSSQLERVQSPQ